LSSRAKSGALLFRFGGVRRLHHDFGEVVSREDFLKELLDAFLGQAVESGFPGGVPVLAVIEVVMKPANTAESE
jgi:hypothetical protein